mmetsp:Transcript_25360/g.51222  ORF Transcript_25360/g.51222 Transcript_25360/m.51222 type:complete len:350 (+) Transcript_25360:104-1153(+)
MQGIRSVLLCATAGLVAVVLQGCGGDDGLGTPGADHTGHRVTTDLVAALCSHVTHQKVSASGLVHEHLEEIEAQCKTQKTEDGVKTCEDEKVAGIERAKENVTSSFIEHCREHVKEDLDGKEPTLELAHPAADAFESSHASEIKSQLHEQIDSEMAKNETGSFTTAEVLCLEEVGKNIETDDDLVHDHFKEIEEACKEKKDVGKCEFGAVKGIILAKGTVMSEYVHHCLHPATWTLHVIHPAIDTFGEKHVGEVKESLHDEIHAAMEKSGLESKTHGVEGKFAVPKKSAALGSTGASAIAGVAGLAACSALVAAGVLALRRRSTRAEAMVAMIEEGEEAMCDAAVTTAE